MTNQVRRRPIPAEVEQNVLTKSRRRCALCFHLNGNCDEKPGQIAHLDHRRSNSVEDNLAWLCTVHHNLYDSVTSQCKNYTMNEVKFARRALYRWAEGGVEVNNQQPSSTVIRGSVSVGLSYSDIRQIVAEERDRIIQEVWKRAQKMLLDARAQPKPLSMKAVILMTEYASQDGECYLRDRWACLLANAASGNIADRFETTYIQLLHSLTSADVLLLDLAFVQVSHVNVVEPRERARQLARADLGSYGDILLMYRAGRRLRGEPSEADSDRICGISLDNLLREGLLWRKQVKDRRTGAPSKKTHYFMTLLGWEFVVACKSPRSREAM